MNDDQNAIHQALLKLVEGKRLTKKERDIYKLALLYEFRRNFPDRIKFLKDADMEVSL